MAKSRRAAAPPRSERAPKRATEAAVEIVEEKKGMNWESGVAVITGLLLFVAILLTDYHLGAHYAGGLFFK
jgi:hypothetical protein